MIKYALSVVVDEVNSGGMRNDYLGQTMYVKEFVDNSVILTTNVFESKMFETVIEIESNELLKKKDVLINDIIVRGGYLLDLFGQSIVVGEFTVVKIETTIESVISEDVFRERLGTTVEYDEFEEYKERFET